MSQAIKYWPSSERVPILNKKELIKMKRGVGRPQDLGDVRALEELQ